MLRGQKSAGMKCAHAQVAGVFGLRARVHLHKLRRETGHRCALPLANEYVYVNLYAFG